MASLLRALVCMLVLATNLASYRANHDALGNGFKILSEGEYSKMVNVNDLSYGKALVQCNFDNGWCGFRNEKVGDNFDWTLRSRSTPSAQTGPSSDISGKGSYAYIETSRPQKSGHKARLLTPVLPGKVYCLQFGFHAYGNDVGALVVHRIDSGRRKYFLLKLEKNHGNKWLHVVGTIAHPHSFQIEFEGIRGNGYRGDIALDNIMITTGKCHEIGECGFGYPPFNSWHWLVSLSPSGQPQLLCTAAYISNDWILTSKTCARKFTNQNVTTYRGNGDIERKSIVTLKEYPSKMSETALLQLSKPTSQREMDKVCPPLLISSSLFGRSLKECYLLAISFSVNVKVKVLEESTVTILPMDMCAPYGQSEPRKDLDKRRLLCVQPGSRFKVKPTASEIDGYVVCKNTISQRWTLHGVGSFSYPNSTGKPLIFTHVSNVMDWIEKIVNISIVVPKLPLVNTPEPPKEPSRGFQIFEQTNQKCLAFVSTNNAFVYQTCNIYDISQRFDWSLQNQILIVKTNRCLTSEGSPYYYLRAAHCYATRKSQKWTCMDSRIRNDHHNKWFSSFGLAEKPDRVRLNDRMQQKGHFVIYGTQDNVCSRRKTVNGIFRCNFDRDPMCGFENTNGKSQFTWTSRKPNVNEMKVAPGLQSSDTIFETARRGRLGDKAAILSSPWFDGQRCVQFYSYVDGSQYDQLRIVKYERGGRKTILRVSGRKGQRQWLFHRVTFIPKLCETYQVLFQAFLPSGGNAKVGLRDVQLFTGACEPTSNKKDGKCLKGWRFFKGACFYPYDIKTTWHQALAVCQITGADLPTDIVVSKLIPRGGSSWFGIRSCPNGRTYSTQAIQYEYKRTSSAKATCLQLHMSTMRGPVYKSGSCDLKVPFVCQKEPEKTEKSCGLMNSSSIIKGPTSNVVDADRQWRWHVVILIFRKCVCGGTLVAPGYVVTSSICVSRVPLGIIKIFIPSSRDVIHKVQRVIYHPRFGLKSGDNDIAIIMFDETFLSSFSIHFACVNKMTKVWKGNKSSKNVLLKDTRCFVLGWGTYRGGLRTCGPKNYKVHEVEILERAQCEEYYGKHIMTERMLCIRPRSQGNRTCLGDTGGPLVCNIAGAWTLVGVTIWGTGCTETRKYGIYTDVASMKSWMDEVTK